jgi:hypothetical protein
MIFPFKHNKKMSSCSEKALGLSEEQNRTKLFVNHKSEQEASEMPEEEALKHEMLYINYAVEK